MPIEAILFNEDDQLRANVYDYLVECERKEVPAKLKEIENKLQRSRKAVKRRIQLYWNEFISLNPDEPGYIVAGLKKYPKEYFVLASRPNQAKYFSLFQRSIEKHTVHVDYVKRAEAGEEGVSQLLLFDGVPPLITDEGKIYPDDAASLELDELIRDEDEDVEIELITKREDTPILPSAHRLPKSDDPIPVKPPDETKPDGDINPPPPPPQSNWKRRLVGIGILAVVAIVIVIVAIKYIPR